MGAISYIGMSGAGSTMAQGTTSVAVAYPTLAAGDMLILVMGVKYSTSTPTTPSGWTALGSYSGGSGTGVDVGSVKICAFYKIADGTETGNLTVSVPSGSSCDGFMCSFRKDAGDTWDTPTDTGSAMTTPATAILVTGGNLGCDTGDGLIAALKVNGNAFTNSGHTVTTPGCSTSVVQAGASFSNNSGDDSILQRQVRTISAGPQSGNSSYATTSSGSNASSPVVAGIFVRIRALTPAAGQTPTMTLLGLG